jgi:hypothetical protein
MSNSISLVNCHKYINYLYIDSGKIKQYEGNPNVDDAPAPASIIELRDLVQSVYNQTRQVDFKMAGFINGIITRLNRDLATGFLGAILSFFGIGVIDQIQLPANHCQSFLFPQIRSSEIEVVDEELKQLETQSSCIINVGSTEESGARAIDVKKQLLRATSDSAYVQKKIDEISKILISNWSGQDNEKYYFSFDERKQKLEVSCHEFSDSSWSDAKSLKPLYTVTIEKKTN